MADDVAQDAFERAIAALDPGRRAVVVLHHWLGYPTAEVAGLLGIPVGTVHSRPGRAMAELRDRLEVEDVGRP
jgi:RNA polymerase sigma factor (sigma-70 family)